MKERTFNNSQITFTVFIILGLLLLPTMVKAVCVRWSPVLESDLSGYKIYYGTQSRSYTTVIDVGKVEEYEICDLEPGQTYYFVLTSYDNWYNESGYSVEMVFKKKRAVLEPGWTATWKFGVNFNPGELVPCPTFSTVMSAGWGIFSFVGRSKGSASSLNPEKVKLSSWMGILVSIRSLRV